MAEGISLRVYFSPFMPEGMQWISEVRDGWRVLKCWRPTMAEVMALGMEDFLARIKARRVVPW